MAVASAGPYANNLHPRPDRQPRQHLITQLFTGRMPFMPPNQQRQSTEGSPQAKQTTTERSMNSRSRLPRHGIERLFRRIYNNSSHVLRGLLPPRSMATQQYSLRRRPHDRQMPDHTGHLADKNLLIRWLYKDSYRLFLYCSSVLSVSIRVLSHVNKATID